MSFGFNYMGSGLVVNISKNIGVYFCERYQGYFIAQEKSGRVRGFSLEAALRKTMVFIARYLDITDWKHNPCFSELGIMYSNSKFLSCH